MNLDEAQTAAVTAPLTDLCIMAGAGSGKTRVIVERIKHMISIDVDPKSILALTYTRRAAREMVDRLHADLGRQAAQITTTTIHGFCLLQLQRFGANIGWRPDTMTVFSEDDSKRLMDWVLDDLGFRKNGVLKKIKRRDIDKAMTQLGVHGTWPDKEKNPDLYLIIKGFYASCRESNTLTYPLILVEFERLMAAGDVTQIAPGDLIRNEYQHVIVDEVQDTTILQWRLIKSLRPETLMTVGDLRQCQPAGTMVLMGDGSSKPIEQLSVGEKVTTYCRKEGTYVRSGEVTEIGNRMYDGYLYSVTAGGKTSRATTEHRWLVKWANMEEKKWATYVMRSGSKYRVGMVQMFIKFPQGRGNLMLGLNNRMQSEKADAGWIIGIHDTQIDAFKSEQLLSQHYGLPQMTFIKVSDARGQKDIDYIYENYSDLRSRTEKCLFDHGLDIRFPLIDREDKQQRRGGSTYFKTNSCNLVAKYMAIPVTPEEISFYPRKSFVNDWKEVSVSKEKFDGMVYSLNIDKHHLYVADGVVTHNSIFSFAGADPVHTMAETKTAGQLYLANNYRSAADIVAEGNRCMQDWPEMTAIKPVDHPVIFTPSNSENIINVVNLALKQGYQFGDIAILCRVHRVLAKSVDALRELGADIYYPKELDTNEDHPDTAAIHALMALAVNPHDLFSFRAIAGSLGLPATTIQEIRSEAKSKGISFIDAHHTITGMALDPHAAITTGQWNTDISRWIELNLADQDYDYKKYLQWYAMRDLQANQEVVPEGHIVALSGHQAKGLEFPCVIVIGASEGILPSKMCKSDEDIEEERRVYYVMATRAKGLLIICPRPDEEPSRFIAQ